ncbi:MAG: hypothetical protein SGPRY_000929, partial [Prymnesium sp.]
ANAQLSITRNELAAVRSQRHLAEERSSRLKSELRAHQRGRAVAVLRVLLHSSWSVTAQLAKAVGHWRGICWQVSTVQACSLYVSQLEAAISEMGAESRVLQRELQGLEKQSRAEMGQLEACIRLMKQESRRTEHELRRVMMPLALQEETTKLKTALERETELRSKAELTLAKLQRQNIAVDSQRQQALDRSDRLQRERKNFMGEMRLNEVVGLLRRSIASYSYSWRLIIALFQWRHATSQCLLGSSLSTHATDDASPIAKLWRSLRSPQ